MPRRLTFRRLAAVSCLGAATLQGCYASVATPPSGPTPNGDVEVRLTPEGAGTLVSSLGPRAATLEGRLIDRTDTTLTMVVSRVARTTGTQEDWPSDRVTVPVGAVRSVIVRRLSVGRSVAFAAVGAAALFLVGRSLKGIEGSGSVRGGPSSQGK
jgi:hypothetical protein